jgi:hypothetical protein
LGQLCGVEKGILSLLKSWDKADYLGYLALEGSSDLGESIRLPVFLPLLGTIQ